MIYFYLGLATVAACVLNGFTFTWFRENQDSNQFHKVVNLWLKDPIQTVVLVDYDAECPEDSSEEQIIHQYGGQDGLCQCKQNDSYSTDQGQYTEKIGKCGFQYCSNGYQSVRVADYIPSQNLKMYILESGVKKKICITRYEGYSFANKAPLEANCDSDEKQCSWKSYPLGSGDSFDMDHSYCIPEDKECYAFGVQLGDYNTKQLEQLPLVGFGSSYDKTNQYNVIDYTEISEIDLLKMNQIDFDPEYEEALKDSKYQIETLHMPRVKARCRSSLKDTLGTYMGNEKAYELSIGILAVSILSGILGFSLGIQDICHMVSLKKKDFYYCASKRVSKDYSVFQNIILILKPLSLFTQAILLLVLIKKYLIIYDEIKNMVDDQCLDEYMRVFVQSSYFLNPSLCDPTFIYVSIGLSSACFIFDQNVYLLIKNIILVITCQKKVSCRRDEQQIVNENNNQNQNKARTQSQGNLFQERNVIANNLFNYPPANKNINLNTNNGDNQILNNQNFANIMDLYPQNPVQNHQTKDELEKLRRKQEKMKKKLEQMKLEEARILAQNNNKQSFLFQSNAAKPPQAPQPPPNDEEFSDSYPAL